MLRAELGNPIRQKQCCSAGRARNSKAVRSLLLHHKCSCLDTVGQNRMHPISVLLARASQMQGLGISDKESCPKKRLELHNLFANRALRHIQFLGCSREVAVSCGCVEENKALKRWERLNFHDCVQFLPRIYRLIRVFATRGRTCPPTQTQTFVDS
ncbi:hypothetical protein DO72_2593 [Burkholderia pseudomallei]|nr:hypothetical protein DO72_2593 [Burkholderia pseudomallei]KGS39311.1 hypothetical protein X945_4622 [Burkholderia pseudomallei ABCPW 107]KGW21333.1 hypothetical protein Y047_4588 [Burkholderia pseudomallei MSHR3016]